MRAPCSAWTGSRRGPARSARDSARTTASCPCRRAPAARAGRAPGAGRRRRSRSRQTDARRQVVGVDHDLHQPDHQEVVRGQRAVLPRHVRRVARRRDNLAADPRAPAPGSTPSAPHCRPRHRVEVVSDRGVLLGVHRRGEPVGPLVRLGERDHRRVRRRGRMAKNSTAVSGWLTRCRARPPTVAPGSADSFVPGLRPPRGRRRARSGLPWRGAGRRGRGSRRRSGYRRG